MLLVRHSRTQKTLQHLKSMTLRGTFPRRETPEQPPGRGDKAPCGWDKIEKKSIVLFALFT